MIRVAATADVHFAEDLRGSLRSELENIPAEADAFLIAGDLTMHGLTEEAAVLADELRGLNVPTVCVLGNHDYHSDQEKQIQDVMEEAGIRVLEGQNEVLTIGNETLGVSGVKGFGGGFADACASDFGEPEMKAFVHHTRDLAMALQARLEELRATYRLALLHYSPCADTLEGERPEIFAFLGSYLLADAIDEGGADLALHGHAHAGAERGYTAGGTEVRNVATHVTGRPYVLIDLNHEGGP